MIQEQENIFIVGGGPSAKGIDFKKFQHKGYLLGVNDSGVLLNVDGVLTMDRLWWENRWEQCKAQGMDCFVRHSVYDRWISKHPGWAFCHRLEIHYDKTELSQVPYIVHGNNSGFAAFNLATLCRPRKIFLFGFDFQGVGKDVHWYPQYTWSTKDKGDHYKKWAPAMENAYTVCQKIGIQVYNCSNISRIQNIPRVKESEILGLC